MSNDFPIEPNQPNSGQNQPQGGEDFLDLGAELERKSQAQSRPQGDGSWLLDGEEPAAPEIAPVAPLVEPLPQTPADPVMAEPAQTEPVANEPVMESPPQLVPSGEVPSQPAEEAAPEAEPWLMQVEEQQQGAGAPTVTVPVTLQASYCEPEPTSYAVGRAAKRGVIALAMSVGLMGVVQISRQEVRTGSGDAPAPAKLEKDLYADTVLVGPSSSNRLAANQPAPKPTIPATFTRPANPDELTIWDTPAADVRPEEETSAPFDLEDPGVGVESVAESVGTSEPSLQPGVQPSASWTEEEITAEIEELARLADALEGAQPEMEVTFVSEPDLWSEERIDEEIADLQKAASDPHPYQPWAHVQDEYPLFCGPVCIDGNSVEAEELFAQRVTADARWWQAVDPYPITPEATAYEEPEWMLAEYSEITFVPEMPQPLVPNLESLDALTGSFQQTPFAWYEPELVEPELEALEEPVILAYEPEVLSAPELDEEPIILLAEAEPMPEMMPDPMALPAPTSDSLAEGPWVTLPEEAPEPSLLAESSEPLPSDYDEYGQWNLGHGTVSAELAAEESVQGPVTDQVVLEVVEEPTESGEAPTFEILTQEELAMESGSETLTADEALVAGPEVLQADVPDNGAGEVVVLDNEGPEDPRAASRLTASPRGMFDLYGEFLSTGEVPDEAHAGVAPVTIAQAEGHPGAGDSTDEALTMGPTIDPGHVASEVTGDGTPTVEAGPDPVAVAVNGLDTEPLPPTEPEKPTRSGALRRIPSEGRWSGMDIPESHVDDKDRLFTPNVGEIRVTFASGRHLDGKLHSVGQGRVWLDTESGRMALEARGIASLSRTTGNGEDRGQRVVVKTRGGVLVGTLVQRVGDQVTLDTDEGVRMTVTSEEVSDYREERRRVGIRRRASE